jgi:hypothetical protein
MSTRESIDDGGFFAVLAQSQSSAIKRQSDAAAESDASTFVQHQALPALWMRWKCAAAQRTELQSFREHSEMTQLGHASITCDLKGPEAIDRHGVERIVLAGIHRFKHAERR